MKQLILSITALTALTISSCNRHYYKPNPVNVPLFTKGGQAHVNISGGFGNQNEHNVSFADLQACISPLNHLGIIANYSSYTYTTTRPDFMAGNVDAHSDFFEAGVGAYRAKGGDNMKLVLDIYAGGGAGSMTSDINMKFSRLFIQPGIGVRSRYIDIAFSPRISRISYSAFNANGRDSVYLINQGLVDILGGKRIDGRSYTFFEPCITIRGGYKFAKIQLQVVSVLPTTTLTWNYNPFRASAGLYITVEDIIAAIRKANR